MKEKELREHAQPWPPKGVVKRPKKWHMQVGPPIYNTDEADAYMDALEAENRRLHDSIEMLETLPGNEWLARHHDETIRRDAALIEALLDALEDYHAQHRCGCGHPACKSCGRGRRAEQVIARAKGVDFDRSYDRIDQ